MIDRTCSRNVLCKAYGEGLDNRHTAEEHTHRMPRWSERVRRNQLTGRSRTFSVQSDARSYMLPLAEVFRMARKECSHISIDPEVMAGAPCISGTRIPVYGVLDAIEHHGTLDGVLRSYPRLTTEEVKDAVLFAKLAVECPVED